MVRKVTQEYLRSLLREAGYKATSGRLALLDILKKSKEPLSIPDIMAQLSKVKGPKVDQVTAYRTLVTLEKIGAVRQLDLRHGHVDYEFAPQDDHHHLNCLDCGKIKDFKGCNLRPVIKKALKDDPDFSEISEHSLELFGLCKSCASKKS